MERSIITTADGSHTVAVPGMNVTYHSHHGAIRESKHVFIEVGLHPALSNRLPVLHILEMGFGTGLNALLTLEEAGRWQQPVHYTSLEKFPLGKEQTSLLNYCEQLLMPGLQPLFDRLHESEWQQDIALTSFFTLHKKAEDLEAFQAAHKFHLIYFDAFAPAAQPELWTEEIFRRLAGIMHPGALLVTYCSKGEVRRAMQAAGLAVEKLPGPPGKREIVRAVKK